MFTPLKRETKNPLDSLGMKAYSSDAVKTSELTFSLLAPLTERKQHVLSPRDRSVQKK